MKTTALDAYEVGMQGYLADGSSMPRIVGILRSWLAGDDDRWATDDGIAERIYFRHGQGDMGRGDVKRAVAAARADFAQKATATGIPQWRITGDRICPGEESEVGARGPSGHLEDVEMPYEFRMLDGDGEVYYLGRSSHRDVFAPLDQFGEPNAGCASIQYKNDAGAWTEL